MATPYYLFQDPKSEVMLGSPVGGITTESAFSEKLQAAVDAYQRVGRLDTR